MGYFDSFGQSGREDGYISVFISRDAEHYPPVPLELQSFITPEEWERRLAAINQLGRRYSKPRLEGLWIFLGFILMLATPVVVYRVLSDKILNNGLNRDNEVKFSELRFITFGIFIAVLLLAWGPLVIWKGVGRHRVRSIIREWSQIDALAKNKGLFVPIWTATLPSGYSSLIAVQISIPPRSNPTTFHPDAYLPAYIAPPQYMPGYGYGGQVQEAGAFQDVKI